MKKWETEILAIDPKTGEQKIWAGAQVPGITLKDAQQYCENNGLGYCRVVGELIAEIPCKNGSHEPDIDNMIDYEQIAMN